MIKKLLNVPAEAIASRHIYKVLHHFPVKVVDKNVLQFDISELSDEEVIVHCPRGDHHFRDAVQAQWRQYEKLVDAERADCIDSEGQQVEHRR